MSRRSPGKRESLDFLRTRETSLTRSSRNFSALISMCNQMVTSEIIPEFHEYTIWLPINIMGDELR